MTGEERIRLFAAVIPQLSTAHGIERVSTLADLWFTADGDRWLIGELLLQQLRAITEGGAAQRCARAVAPTPRMRVVSMRSARHNVLY